MKNSLFKAAFIVCTIVFLSACKKNQDLVSPNFKNVLAGTRLDAFSTSNLISNPGFESGAASPWTTSGTVTVSTSNVHSGSYAVSETGSSASLEQVISGLSPNTTYTFSGWAAVGTSGQTVSLGVKSYGGSQVLVTASTTTYTQYQVSFTTGSTNTQATVFFYKPNSGTTAYGDDFNLVAVPTTNFVSNPGLESGAVSPWTISGSITVSTSNVHSGSYAVSETGSSASLEQVISGLSPNTAYTFSGWAAVGTSGQTVSLGVKSYGGSQVLVTASTTTYTQYQVNFTTGSTNTQATVFFYKPNAGTTAFGDDFNLVVKAAPSPTTYYVDNVNGNDAANGQSAANAWSSLAKVNSTTFNPGDKIYFKAGDSWSGQLNPLGSGISGSQITIDMYGSGAKPKIAAGGIAGGALYLYNQQYWVINNLDLSNTGSSGAAKKKAISIVNDCVGTLNSIYINNCNIHDVNGVMDSYNDGKESGGIVFSVTASNINLPSNWNDIRITNNTITNVAREGILLQSLFVNKSDPNVTWTGLGNYYPSSAVYIANNTLNQIAGDGIVFWSCKGALVERNYVNGANTTTLFQGHVAIWPYISESCIFQYNEVANTGSIIQNSAQNDGMAFDFDNANLNCIYQYNYSHNNLGGFLNLCSSGASNGNIARYNISQNDGNLSGSQVFVISQSGNVNDAVYNNTLYINTSNPQLIRNDGASGSSISFSNNIIYNQGSGAIASSYTGASFIRNLYWGNGSVSSDATKIVADPLFVSPGSGGTGLSTVNGYYLKAGSPALGAGNVISGNGGIDYWGNSVSPTNAPNLGAYNGSGH